MKHALNQTRAASGAPRAGRLARLVRGGVAACALVLLAAGSAQAQRQDQVRDDPRMQQDPRMQDQRGYERAQEPARDYRYDSREFDQRRQQMQQDQQMRNSEARRSGRLTPDERRDLRRQINEAGMDLYPPRSRR